LPVPHLAWPLRLTADGTFLTVEQDSLDDVRQCVAVLLNTPRGVRPLAPDVGIEDPTFAGADPDGLQQTLEEQEPRATLTVTAGPPDATGEQTVQIIVDLASEPA
jgi:phage baseplate assembly protein W